MAIIKSIRIKTVSFRELRASVSADVIPHLDCDIGSGELKGIIVPCRIRVRTSAGIHTSDYLFLSRAPIIQVTFDDDTYFGGTSTHKLCTDIANDAWVTMGDLEVGQRVARLGSYAVVTSKVQLATEAVADICVPGPHNYLLENGVVSHNSLMANDIGMNVADRGYKVVIVPLEMSKIEQTSRIVSRLSGLDVTKVLQRKLSEGEKELAYKKYERWVRRAKTRGGRLTIYKPPGDVSIEDIFAAVSTFDCDLLIIDYISLLSGADGDDSWQKLGAIARLAKVNAENTNRANMLLCQVSDEGKIRYARAISEHSTNSWIWQAPKEEREKAVGRIRVEQPKSRNSRSFPFEVGFSWANMRVVPVESVTADVGDVAEPMKNLADC